MNVSREERLDELFRRLAASPPPATADEAFALICRLLDDVEDQLSGIVKADPPPTPGLDDGRTYAPQADRVVRDTRGRLMATTRGHLLVCDVNGGFRIINSKSGLVEFER